MSVYEFTHKGVKYWRVYVNIASTKVRTLRMQYRTPLKELIPYNQKTKANRIEKQKIAELTTLIAQKETQGLTWENVVQRWEDYWIKYPSRRFNDDTLRDHVSRMQNWTNFLFNKPVNALNTGDAREIINRAFEDGASYQLRKDIRSTFNIIFKWALEERLIDGIEKSPAANVEILGRGEARPNEKRPEILNQDEIATLLKIAEDARHPWFPVWFFGFNSGMRSGELEGLRKSDLELVPVEVAKKLDKLPSGDSRKNYGWIHVQRAWKTKKRDYGSTKGRYWRNVPINSNLYWWLMKDYLPNSINPKDEHGERLFPDLPYWKRGEQAKVLRLFCENNNLKSIKFHTIRACFATQLLGQGVPEMQVMKIGGWSDVKTMMIYCRMAGIQEFGATEGLRFRSSNSSFDGDPNDPHLHLQLRSADQIEFDQPSNSMSSPKELENVVSLSDLRRRKDA